LNNPRIVLLSRHAKPEKEIGNDYTTSLTGLKFKIAHKRAGSEKWSATPRRSASG
jgi:hypothetical protein